MLSVDLTHHFLMALPHQKESFFSGSLVYVCQHSEEGAVGLIVNRPSEMSWTELFKQLNIPLPENDQRMDQPVYIGGPIQPERGFVLHQPQGGWSSTVSVHGSLALTASKDVLLAASKNKGPARLLVSLGHAGWGAGQLEQELAKNVWLTTPADTEILFETPANERLSAVLHSLGINPVHLSLEPGHA